MEEDNARIRDEQGTGIMPSEPAENHATAPLLGLPHEIRNIIYTLCLVKGTIQITKQMKPPALVSTCRQIRYEALPMWLPLNHFELLVEDCGSTLFRHFRQNLTGSIVEQTSNAGSAIALGIEGVNWANLVEWCRAVWGGEIEGSDPPDNLDDEDYEEDYALIAAATTIASESMESPWEVVELQLTALRPVAVILNSQWKH